MTNELSATETGSNSNSFRNVPRALLVALRVHLGIIFLITDFGKMFLDDKPFSEAMLGFLQNYAMKNASAPYQGFLQGVVIPHATLFSYLIMAGELIAGISLYALPPMTRVGQMIWVASNGSNLVEKHLLAHLVPFTPPALLAPGT